MISCFNLHPINAEDVMNYELLALIVLIGLFGVNTWELHQVKRAISSLATAMLTHHNSIVEIKKQAHTH